MILPTMRPLRVWGTAHRALDLDLLVLRLESYLTERIELAYTFDMDQGPLAKAEGLRQSVSPARHQANASPCRPHAEQGSPYHSLLLSSFSGKAESLYARLGSHAAPWTGRGVFARLHAAPGI